MYFGDSWPSVLLSMWCDQFLYFGACTLVTAGHRYCYRCGVTSFGWDRRVLWCVYFGDSWPLVLLSMWCDQFFLFLSIIIIVFSIVFCYSYCCGVAGPLLRYMHVFKIMQNVQEKFVSGTLQVQCTDCYHVLFQQSIFT